jgi:hypothetical protein
MIGLLSWEQRRASKKMNYTTKSIRAFIGAKNFERSRAFYLDLGFNEVRISLDMSLFEVSQSLSFYLQDAYAKDWINNSMLFLEVNCLEDCERTIKSKGLDTKYPEVRFTQIKTLDWGQEFFMHDPSGVSW